MRNLVHGLFILLLSAWTTTAFAEVAYTRSNVNLRTGPDSGYPAITQLPAGLRVDIYGCVDDWAWCDIDTGRERGWVSASYLSYD